MHRKIAQTTRERHVRQRSKEATRAKPDSSTVGIIGSSADGFSALELSVKIQTSFPAGLIQYHRQRVPLTIVKGALRILGNSPANVTRRRIASTHP